MTNRSVTADDRVKCPTCGKLLSRRGVSMHHIDKHGTALLKIPDPPGPSFSPNFDERDEQPWIL